MQLIVEEERGEMDGIVGRRWWFEIEDDKTMCL